MTLHSTRRDARTDLLHGTLDMLILRTLLWGPHHGYAIGQTIRAQSSEVLQVEAGSLYPALQRLVVAGGLGIGSPENFQLVRHLASVLGAEYGCSRPLVQKGWVTSKWGQTEANQRAKFYRLTPEGKKQLLREESRWSEMVNAIGRVMNPALGPGGPGSED